MITNTQSIGGSEARIITRLNPVDGDVVSTEPAHGVAECCQYAADAAAAFPTWSQTSPERRARLMLRVADLIEKEEEFLCQVMAEEIAASRSWARHNVEFSASILRETARLSDNLHAASVISKKDGAVSSVEQEACGVCLGVAPWNAPLILGVRAVAAPLMCGNTVLLKGSEIAPRTFNRLGEIFHRAGVPRSVMKVILNAPEDSELVVEALVGMPVVRRVNFTGSSRTGRRIAEICAHHLKRPLLVLSGHAPMIITDDADLDLAAEAAIAGGFLNQGQICMSTERLIVSENVVDDLLSRLGPKLTKLRLGDPVDVDVDVGPVINVAAAERLSGLISDAVSKGAKLICGGHVRDAFVEPTVIDRVERDMRLYREEAFGPILWIARVADDAEAITVANDSEYGLAASVFCRNGDRAHAIASQIHTGICHINRSTVHDDPSAPFGGMKSSGYGRLGGKWALDEFTETRWVTAVEDSIDIVRTL